MKKIVTTFLATALATASLAGAAQAQSGHSSQTAPSKQTQTIRHETQQQKQHQQEKQQTAQKAVTKQASSSRYAEPPKHWGKKSNQEWQRHVDRCRAKYRSYNPKTDRFVPRHGQTAICRL